MNLGKKIQFLRKQKGLTQKELAKIFSVTRGSLANWEIDRASPDIETIDKMADFFGVSVDYLLGRKATQIKMDDKFLDLSSLTQPQRNAIKAVYNTMIDKNTKQKEDSE